MSTKRLIRSLSKQNPTNLDVVLGKKFGHGTQHKCRILDYNRLQGTYVCTFEQVILKEKTFTAHDLQVGQFVSAKVSSLTDAGLLVKCGQVDAFIENLHLSNTVFSENIKRHFKVGQMLQARVWAISEKGVLLTLKEGLIKSELCLSEYNRSAQGKQFPGVVGLTRTKTGAALIAFYGGLRGVLPKKYMLSKSDDNDGVFFTGQVVGTCKH